MDAKTQYIISHSQNIQNLFTQRKCLLCIRHKGLRILRWITCGPWVQAVLFVSIGKDGLWKTMVLNEDRNWKALFTENNSNNEVGLETTSRIYTSITRGLTKPLLCLQESEIHGHPWTSMVREALGHKKQKY